MRFSLHSVWSFSAVITSTGPCPAVPYKDKLPTPSAVNHLSDPALEPQPLWAQQHSRGSIHTHHLSPHQGLTAHHFGSYFPKQVRSSLLPPSWHLVLSPAPPGPVQRTRVGKVDRPSICWCSPEGRKGRALWSLNAESRRSGQKVG